MFKNVYSRGVGGQNSAKFGLRSFWMTPTALVLTMKVSGFDKVKNISLLYILGIYFKSIIVLMNKQKRWKIWIYVRWNFSPNTEIILWTLTDAWKKKERIDTVFFTVSIFMHHFGFKFLNIKFISNGLDPYLCWNKNSKWSQKYCNSSLKWHLSLC